MTIETEAELPEWRAPIAPPIISAMHAPPHSDLAPTEQRLAGRWLDTPDGPRGDDVELRIAWLVAHRLVALGRSADGWDWLFRDPHDGRLWELTFPFGSLHGRGPRQLTLLSAEAASTKYEGTRG